MSADFESPFLDRDTPIWPRDDEHETPSAELESAFESFLSEEESEPEQESPFVQGESEEESPFLSGEGEGETFDTRLADEGEAAPDEGYEAEFEQEMEAEGADESLFDPRELEEGEAEEAGEEEGEGEGAAEPEWSRLVPDELEAFIALGHGRGSNGGGEPSGEIVLLDELDEAEAEEEGEFAEEGEAGEPAADSEFILLPKEGEYGLEEGQLPYDTIPTIGRVLWPALGFPAVVTPSATPKQEPSFDVDATRCLTFLVLTNTPKLPPSEVAKRLRIVPWKQRSKRHIAEGKLGSYKATDFVVRTDSAATRLTLAQPKGATEQLIGFGEGAGRVNMIIVNLAKKVRETYDGWGMKYLHEIRLSEAQTAKLGAGQFHVFFNNLGTKEDAPSDEMALLISLGKKRRAAELNQLIAKMVPDAEEEYQFEYGTIKKPYSARRTKKRRAELLHPIFIRKTASPKLRLGHVTDLHVDVRTDVYQYNLQRKGKFNSLSFNNWNDSTSQIYATAKKDSDGLFLTGDLIDYGRGHVGIDKYGFLGDDRFYHRDRNWLLFYDIIAGEDRYTVPVYTCLGNHDWRLNPYPPFAVAGAPSPRTLINDYDCFKPEQMKELLQIAHGDGYELEYSYHPKWKTLDLVDIVKTVRHARGQNVKLEEPGLPTETSIESVLWYLLTINPFLDYLWALPSKHRVLVLDWGEDEGILFKKIEDGVESDYSATPSGIASASDPGPKAYNSLNAVQRLMVEHLVKLNSPSKIIAMHAPPLGPWTDWGDDDLRNGFKVYKKRPSRGPLNYAQKKNGKIIAKNGHPLFAIPPKRGPKGQLSGMDADYNTIMQGRDWFIRTLADPKAGVRLVLSGHIHRNGRLGVHIGTKADGEIVEGEYLLRSLDHKEAQGAKVPAISTTDKRLLAPLYVNTTSAGLRGNNYPTEGKHLNVDPGFARVEINADGVIGLVSFRRPVNARKARCDVGKARTAKGLPAFAF